MQNFEIKKYTEIALRRKYWIIISFLLSIFGGMVYYLVVPKTYEAATLILVQPQRVPEEYVRPIMEGTVDGRLRTLSQQVTSRTNLEKIISEHKLDREYNNSYSEDRLVEAVRKRIRIEVRGDGRGRETSTFNIAFESEDPVTAMKVANALASNFITENLKVREEQAQGTSGFLSDELDGVRKRLAGKESDLKEYREKYMGGLPEQLQTNLNILERLERQSDRLNNAIKDSENRKILIQTQIGERSRTGAEGTIAAMTESNSGERSLGSLRNELSSLESRYTNNHPDVIRIRELIAVLEGRVSSEAKSSESGRNTSANDFGTALKKQSRDVEIEINSLKEELRNNRSQANWYKNKVEDTPRREQELLSINRDYENLKGLYNSLLNRKLEAEIAVSMERKQKGEQFRIIDPAKTPTHPLKPDIFKIAVMTLLVGIGLGGGLAYVVEIMDSSYQQPEEIERELKIPVLMSIPVRHSVQEMKRIKRIELLKAASVSVGFVVSAAGIVLATKGVSKTIEFLNGLIHGI